MTDKVNKDRAASKARSLANLKPPWKPGQSGNPTGRPLNWDMTMEAVRQQVLANAEAIVARCIKKALRHGDVAAMKLLLDRILPAPQFVGMQVQSNSADVQGALARLDDETLAKLRLAMEGEAE